MKALTQYQPNWSEANVPKPRNVMWLTPENVQDTLVLSMLVKECKCAGWTGLGNEMVIVTFPTK